MASTTVVPGSELFFTDSTSGIPYPLPGSTLVGSEPVFSDGSDTTYADLGEVHGHPLGTDIFASQRMYAQLQAVDLTTTGLSATFRADQATIDVGFDAPIRLDIAIMDKSGPGSTEADFALTLNWQIFPEITKDSGFTTYTADLTTPASNPYSSTLADIVALIAAGNAWVFLATFGTAFSGFDGSVESRVSEFSISDALGFVPPLRLTNRDDVFSSAPSLTRSRSQQGTNSPTAYL